MVSKFLAQVSAGVLATVLGGALSLAHADTVVMNNGLSMEGKVQEERPDYIILMVYNNTGKLRIARNQIKSIDYDFATRRDTIAEDDFLGQYNLGKWCLEKGKYAEAVDQFELVRGKEGIPQDLFKLLGQSYDKRGQADKAYDAYKEYVKFKPDDPDVKPRFDELDKKFGAAALAAQAKQPVRNGYEALMNWRGETWANANPCTAKPYIDPRDGNQMILVQSPGGDKDKIAFTGTGKALDLSESKEVIFKAQHNSAVPIRIAVAFVNKAGEFYESREVSLPPNDWSAKAITISGKSFKGTKNGFAGFTLDLSGKENIQKVHFLVYGAHDLTLYIDSVYFR